MTHSIDRNLYLRFALLLTIGLALIWAVPARSDERRMEVFGGSCTHKAVGNGIWWNDKYPNELDLNDGCGLIAVSKITGNQGWRFAYVDLGASRSDAIFPMRDDEQALPAFDGTHCNKWTYSGCLGRGIGVQRARGLSLGYVLENDIGKATFGIEGGAFVYSGTWDVHIISTSGKLDAIDLHWQGLQATPYLGVTARYGYFMAMARVYGNVRAAEHGCGGCSGLAGGNAKQVLVGLSVPF